MVEQDILAALLSGVDRQIARLDDGDLPGTRGMLIAARVQLAAVVGRFDMRPEASRPHFAWDGAPCIGCTVRAAALAQKESISDA